MGFPPGPTGWTAHAGAEGATARQSDGGEDERRLRQRDRHGRVPGHRPGGPASPSGALGHPVRDSQAVRPPARRATRPLAAEPVPAPRQSGSSSPPAAARAAQCAPWSGTSTRSSPPCPSPTRSSSPSWTRRVCSAPRRSSASGRCPPSTRPRSTATPPARRRRRRATAAPIELAVVGESVPGASRAVLHRARPGAQGGRRADASPAGADVVVPAVWTDQGPVRVTARGRRRRQLRAPHRDDVAPGDPAVQVGTPIGPAQISLLAAVGRERVLVRPRPRIAVLCAGTELVDVGTTPAPGQVVDVNSYALAAAARDAGAEAYRSGSCPRTSAASPRCWRASPAQRPRAHRRHVRQRRVRQGAGGARRARRDALPAGHHAPGPPQGFGGWAATRSR